MGRASYAENVERIARTNIAIAVEGEQWDADAFAPATPDGTLDLKSGVLRPSNPSDLMTKQTLVAPSRNEDCPRWLQFLYEATCGDDELISFLKRFVGYPRPTRSRTCPSLHSRRRRQRKIRVRERHRQDLGTTPLSRLWRLSRLKPRRAMKPSLLCSPDRASFKRVRRRKAARGTSNA